MLNKLFRLASFQLPYGRSKSSKFYRSFLSSLHRQNQCAPQIPPEKHYICGIKNLFTLPFIVLLHRWYIETEGSLFSRSLGLPLNFPKKRSFRLHPSLRKKCPYSKLLWSAFSRIWTKCLFVFTPNAGKYGAELLRIRTLFTHPCYAHLVHY